MKVTFLGTGTSSGVPLIGCTCEVCHSDNPKDRRLRSAVIVETGSEVLSIDCGPDFREQILTNKINRIDAVLLTHSHRDHTAGLDELRAFNFMTGKHMPVYLTPITEGVIKKQFDYIFSDKDYPGIPKLELRTYENSPFEIGSTHILPIEVMHYQMQVFGFRIGDFSYITDANYISEAEKQKLKGSKVLVLNALRKSWHLSHFTLEQALAIVDEVAPEKTYLTHISHQLGKHEVINAELPEDIYLAYDRLQIDIPD